MRPALHDGVQSNVYEPEIYFASLTFGPASLASYFAPGCTVVRDSAGRYTLTLPQAYRTAFGVSGTFQDASGALLFPVVASDTVAADGKLVFETRTEAGTATDPSSGDRLHLTVHVSNSFLNG